MSAAYDRSAIMKAAHFTARWRVQSVGGSYREWLAKALASKWKKAKGALLRAESNVGLPVRSPRRPSRAAHASMPPLHHAFRPHRRIIRGLIRSPERAAGRGVDLAPSRPNHNAKTRNSHHG